MDNQSQQPVQPQLVYPVNMTDHDLLIRLDQKVTQLSLDVGKTNDGLTSRLGIVENRIIFYDQLLVEYPPKTNREMVLAHDKWIGDFKLTWKIILSITIALSSIITFTLMAVGQALHIVGFFGGIPVK